MNLREKLKDIDLQNLAGTLIAAFGTISVTGFVQIVYCALTCFSFYLSYKITVSKNEQKLLEMKHNNRLLELDIQIKEKQLENE